MLSLRLARGARIPALLRRLLVAVAAGGAGFLLLCAMGYASGHPERADSGLVRLAWCAVPLAATCQLAVAVGRADPGTRPGPGFTAAGCGPARAALLTAATTALSCALGSVLALLAFLHLRGDLGSSRLSAAGAGRGIGAGTARLGSDDLGAGQPLPFAATLILLAVVPVLAAAVSATELLPWRRPPAHGAGAASGTGGGTGAELRDGDGRDGGMTAAIERAPAGPRAGAVVPASTDLPWAIALIAAGLTLGAYADHGAPPSTGSLLPLPGHATTAGVLGGWALTAVGLVLAGPGLVHLCGTLLATARPGAPRLLAGRVLQREAPRLGRPLGVLCAVGCAVYVAVELYGTGPGATVGSPFGPLSGLGAALVMMCATGTVLVTVAETRSARAETTRTLLSVGAPASALRRAAALRGAALLVVLGPLAWAVGKLSTLPFGS